MRSPSPSSAPAWRRRTLLLPVLAMLPSCATIGSLMSPYSEKFDCKNSDHGQCIHPDKAYDDAVAGRASRSDPAVTADKKLLKGTSPKAAAMSGQQSRQRATPAGSFVGYRDSVYRELQGLIDEPVTPMLRQPRTIRTLILPYADRQRPDRLYMARYVYSILESPSWVVGDYLVKPISPAAQAPVLGQIRERSAEEATAPQSDPRP